MTDLSLAFGLRRDLRGDGADQARALWGARWIWPNDLVWDRQDNAGESVDVGALHLWLNGTDDPESPRPLTLARREAKRLADRHELVGSEDRTVTLYEDERGVIRANPQGSYGYLYVAAWLKGPLAADL